MSKIRVYELAKQLKVPSRDIIELLKEFNFNIKNHMSVVEDDALKVVNDYYSDKDKNIQTAAVNEDNVDGLPDEKDIENELEKIVPEKHIKGRDQKPKKTSNKQVKPKKEKRETPHEKVVNEKAAPPKVVTIRDGISVKELSEKIGKQASDIIKKLIMSGVMATINDNLDFETAQKVALKYGITVQKLEEKSLEEIMIDDSPDKEEDLKPRPPVVTIMGHVDHGKTSLLDAIRETHVTQTEAGGITQHIGAYTVSLKNNGKITFLDTPGHEAFTAMRARGAQATDIAVLVVAADDGVMPQTIEAINHSKAAKVPIVVAINKIDKSNANPDRVKQELADYGLVAEDWGGDTICVPVSAKTKEGIDNLMEMILLVAEMAELKANPNRAAKGIVIESKLDKSRGPIATILVKNGTLNVGDPIIAGVTYGKVRAMLDDKGKSIKSAGPSIPVEVVGFNEVPDAGDILHAIKDEKSARQIVEKRIDVNRSNMIIAPHRVSLENLFDQIEQGEVKDLNIIVKADVQGSVEALTQSFEKLSKENVKVNIIHGGVGAITETDVTFASVSNAVIIGFNVSADTKTRLLAEKENIDIKTYSIIYEAIEDVERAMKGMLEPEYKEEIRGRAEVRATFKVTSVGTIAGCYVTEGKINRSNKVRVIRGGIVIHEGELASLKRFKDDVKEVASGYECGLNVEKFNDIKEGDIIEAYEMVEVARD